MKLSRWEESRLKKEALLGIVGSVLILGLVVWGQQTWLAGQRKALEAAVSTNESLLETNRKDARESRFLRENAKNIDRMWLTLKNWGGGLNAASAAPFQEAGLSEIFPLPSSKPVGNQTEYGGVRILGDRTEFQRLVEALATMEEQEGLAQVRSATLNLPGNAVPNGMRPTFLIIQLEVVGPLTR